MSTISARCTIWRAWPIWPRRSAPPRYRAGRIWRAGSNWRLRGPPMTDEDDILERAAAWRAEGRQLALATVIATWGSSPRPVGSQLAVDQDGNMTGSVSGGCIEGAVVREALQVMADGTPRVLDFGVTDEQAWDVGLACGGKVQVFVERVE